MPLAPVRELSLQHTVGFMFQSWVIDLFFDCPPGIPNVQCPDDANKTLVADAIAAGDIQWHAFPHNAELMMLVGVYYITLP